MRTPPNERLTSDIADASRPRKPGREETCATRKCILKGKTAPRETLVRLAISPSGLVLPDVQAKAPGRGAWIGVTRAELEQAIDKGALRGALARAFKTGDLEITPGLPQQIEDALMRLVLDRLGLEKRTGALILGTQRIADTARAGDVAALYHASDASEDGCKKLDQAWRVGSGREGSGDRGIVLPLDRTALSVALGRENVVHLALADAAAAERVHQGLARLLHYLGETTPADDGEPDAVRGDRTNT